MSCLHFHPEDLSAQVTLEGGHIAGISSYFSKLLRDAATGYLREHNLVE